MFCLQDLSALSVVTAFLSTFYSPCVVWSRSGIVVKLLVGSAKAISCNVPGTGRDRGFHVAM